MEKTLSLFFLYKTPVFDIPYKIRQKVIYITSKSEHTQVIIPRNTEEIAETYDIVLKSHNGQTYSFTGLTDGGTYRYYMIFDIDTTSIPEGEYELTCGIEKGIVRVGEYTHTESAYTDNRTYIEYIN